MTPGIMIANTDTRHYQNLTENTFRFSPTLLQKSDLDRFHGIDERISVENYVQVIVSSDDWAKLYGDSTFCLILMQLT